MLSKKVKVTRKIIIDDYNRFVSVAERLTHDKNYNEALVFIESCARIAYNYNIIYFDKKLEKCLKSISESVLPNQEFDGVPERYVFYDYFGNTKVLTQQYLRALMAWGVEFMYIHEGSEPFSEVLKSEIADYGLAKIVQLKAANSIEKMNEAKTYITNYKPSKAFIHTAPWDVMGICLWNSITQVDRYMINLTDHAFWLGKNAFDYVLEFRSYGYNLSYQAREITKAKLLLQPYYPIQNDMPFEGFPINIEGKVVGFSGSSFYKIYGRNGKFLKLIKRMLDENSDFVFFLAGWGIDEPIREFIKLNNFEDRFIILGERKDIDQVFKHIDLFINTYPFIGGLMTQLAVVNKKAIISYTSDDLTFNFVEDFLPIDKQVAGSIKDEEVFIKEAGLLIRNVNYRSQNVNSYSKSVPSVDEFNNLLFTNCHSHPSYNSIQSIEINYDAIADLYLEVDNDYLHLYQKLKLVNLGYLYFKYLPLSAFKCATLILLTDFKTVRKNVKSYLRARIG